LSSLTEDVGGNTALIVQLGPFGGAQEGGALLWPWSAAYLGLIAATARAAFARRDL
jgi:hypothetical protein